MTSTAAPLPNSLARVVQRFQRLSNPKQRYEQLVWYAKRLKEFPEGDKVSENKVPGCVSQVYITARLDQGKVWYQGDSDSALVKGLVAVLVEGLSGLSPEEILQVSPEFIKDTGLNASLTPSRSNGFYNIFQKMKEKALQLLME
ncbi:SufE family protein [Chroogloeocystis siderophila]|jgi:cysteine desulfuration protein SufE|uniref:Cysteine desufuration protein SufE n=1 Tax=Chroogloeocystis siderophila 5.2 s.c.1 TaxID=247279 RepID=A0A1U7HMC7_9CHRO|nr:SufE family protein [Chroogloeocystis siderophila]OKH24675.1 cysteine desufuration protein SufE [Chroogloeocystis siderophila 5.2 s.c.1]